MKADIHAGKHREGRKKDRLHGASHVQVTLYSDETNREGEEGMRVRGMDGARDTHANQS